MIGLTETSYLTFVILFANEIEALFGSEAFLGSTNSTDYQVYWNVPTFMCHKYGMRFEEVSRAYRIIQNHDDKFRGDEIVIFYDPGMFPALLTSRDGSVKKRNGGVPQEGDLKKHLDLFREHVVEHIPDSSFRGLAVIDFESWRPIFRQNWASLEPYRTLSVKISRERHPKWSDHAIKKESVRRFENYGRIFMEETLKIAKAMRPRATWGYYAYPYCFNYTPQQNRWECNKQVMTENDEMSWLFGIENVLLPSVYLSTRLSGREKIGLINGRVTEAMRISRKMRPRTKVLAYLWYKYQDHNDVFLSREDTVNAIREIMDRGADGYVIWGSSFDLNSREKCQNFRNYLNDILGPAIVASMKMADQRITADHTEADNQNVVSNGHEESSHEHNNITENGENQSPPAAINIP